MTDTADTAGTPDQGGLDAPVDPGVPTHVEALCDFLTLYETPFERVSEDEVSVVVSGWTVRLRDEVVRMSLYMPLLDPMPDAAHRAEAVERLAEAVEIPDAFLTLAWYGEGDDGSAGLHCLLPMPYTFSPFLLGDTIEMFAAVLDALAAPA